MFKKGDYVRAVDIYGIDELILDKLYIVDYCDNKYAYLDVIFNKPVITGGWFFHRFMKVDKSDLTEEEKFSIITYKLGAQGGKV